MTGQAREKMGRRTEIAVLCAILAFSAVLRLRFLDTLLPWFHYEDETRVTNFTLHLIQNRTIDPQYSYYPALGFYIDAIFYMAWAFAAKVAGLAGGAGALAFLDGKKATDMAAILATRWVSLFFGLLTIAVTHLLARLYLSRPWALFVTLLFSLNTLHVVISVLAKIDSITTFWYVLALYCQVRFYRDASWKWMIAACATAGLYLVAKNNYLLALVTCIAVFLALLRDHGWRGTFLGPRLYVAALAMALAAFLGSPYSFIRLDKTLENAGWLYIQAETISTYHTDPHVWWLDRYHYMLSVVLPFVFGPIIFPATVVAAIDYVRRRFIERPLVFLNYIVFLFIFSSQAGGPSGGAMAYYLFLILVPTGLIMLCVLLEDMSASNRIAPRAAAAVVCACVLASAVAGMDNHYRMFFAHQDRLKTWMEENIRPGDRALMVSVYKPMPGPPAGSFRSLWPQDLKAELDALAAKEGGRELLPDNVVIIDTWLVAGFRKVYRGSGVAKRIGELIAGSDGHEVAGRIEVGYFGRNYFTALDVEHDVELVILRRPRKEMEPDAPAEGLSPGDPRDGPAGEEAE